MTQVSLLTLRKFLEEGKIAGGKEGYKQEGKKDKKTF